MESYVMLRHHVYVIWARRHPSQRHPKAGSRFSPSVRAHLHDTWPGIGCLFLCCAFVCAGVHIPSGVARELRRRSPKGNMDRSFNLYLFISLMWYL